MTPPNGWKIGDDWWPSYWAKSYQFRGWTIRVYPTAMPGICEATCWKFGRVVEIFNVEAATLDVVLAAARNAIKAENSRKI